MKLKFSVSFILLSSCLSTGQESQTRSIVKPTPKFVEKGDVQEQHQNEGVVSEEEQLAEKDSEIEETDLPVAEELPPVKEVVITKSETVEDIDRGLNAEMSGDRHSPHKIPIEMNQLVEKWIQYFTEKDRERFQRFLNRGEIYRKNMVRILKENGVPEDMYYLAMIESGFVIQARSHASAVGVWQFIAETGRRYGLEYNQYVDERMDPMRATEAAAFYLRELYTVYQSWYLAMASYNSGENRVLRSVMKSKSRDFWTLVEKRNLPKETMDYVPKFLAAAIIGHNPKQFGFVIEPEDSIDELVSVNVPAAVKLTSIAEVTGVSASLLQKYNPHLRKGMTPPGQADYEIWVPKHKEELFVSNYDEMMAHKIKNVKLIANHEAIKSDVKFHRVKRGENLAIIAGKYGLTVKQVKNLNNLKSSRLFVGRKLKVSESENASANENKNELVAQETKVEAPIHVVKRGENLAMIAEKYGMTTNALRQFNKMRTNTVHVGMKIKVQNNKLEEAITEQQQIIKSTVYTVKKGDNLKEIATSHNVTIQDIKKLNKLRSNVIYPGLKLKIPGGSEQMYTVQKGESIQVIAKKFGTTVASLKEMNKLKRNYVYAGQELVVPQ